MLSSLNPFGPTRGELAQFCDFLKILVYFLPNRRFIRKGRGYHFFVRKGRGCPNSDLRPTMSSI
jgi:hypothetical protein